MFFSSCVKMCQSMQEVRKIEVVESSQQVAARLAEILASAAHKVLQEKDTFTVGLSGGSLIDFLCDGLRNIQTDWAKWRFFFCDERLVPFEDGESTFGLYRKKMVGVIPVHESQFVTVNTALAPQAAADDYEKKLREHFREKVPVFDVLLLGMGPDGHTCSLFPNHPLVDVRDRVVAAIEDSPKPPPARVTLTFPVINAAKLCIFAMAGESKAEMVKRIIQNQEDLPAGRVKPTNGTVLWLLDQKAASQVQTSS